MPMVLNPGDRIVRDRYGRAWVVCYTNPDGSMYGDLSPTPPSRAPHHRHPAHHAHHAHRKTLAAASPNPTPPRINRYTGERIDPNDGMADNQLAQALFHSQYAQGQWNASYRLVRNVTVVYSSVVFIAFFAPEILSGGGLVLRQSSFALRWSLNQAGAFGPAVNRLFWSGSGYWWALRYGSQMGGTVGQTLEESPLGAFLDAAQEFLPKNRLSAMVWQWMSQAWAEGAEGDAIYFEGWRNGMPYQGPAWLGTEAPTLLQRGVPITVVPAVGPP